MKKINLVLFFIVCFQFVCSQTIQGNKRFQNDSIYIDFINPYHAPMEVRLSALDSTKSFINLIPYKILKAKDTLKSVLVIPISKIKDTSAVSVTKYVTFNATFGNPNSKINKDYNYSLPYPIGNKYKIIQSFNGKFSHNSKHSKYAIDFGLQIGDTITAIRPGVVFYIKEDSKEHCKTRKCVDKANKIMVLHNDGTMASYVHLDYDGVLVNEGDKILEGQAIGISGLTGFTTKPHLHLVLYKYGNESVPFYFKGLKGKKLKPGKSYKRNF